MKYKLDLIGFLALEEIANYKELLEDMLEIAWVRYFRWMIPWKFDQRKQ